MGSSYFTPFTPLLAAHGLDAGLEQKIQNVWLQGYEQLQQTWFEGTSLFLDQCRQWLDGSCELQIAGLTQYRKWVMYGNDLVQEMPSLGNIAVEETIKAVGEAAPVVPLAPVREADDLTRIQGLGKVMQQRLREAGIVSFGQIAAWSEADIARVEAEVLGSRFLGRINRDQWQAQAEVFINEG